MDEEQMPPQNTEESLGDHKTTVRKVFDAGSWLVLFLLLPFTVLVLLSQNSLPGSLFYPVKRGMENVILAAASLNPATSVAFRTDLTKRRFSEAQTLLLTRLDTTGLKGFVAEVQAMEIELATVKDPQEKAELQDKINNSLAEYQEQLQTVKTQIIAQNQSFAPTPTSVFNREPTVSAATASPVVPTNTPVPVPTVRQGQRPLPTNTSVPLPTAQPTVRPTSTPAQTRTAPTATRVPYATATQIPSLTATSVPSPTPVPSTGGTTNPIDDIDAVQVYLQCLRNHPDNPNACVPANLSAQAHGQNNKQEKGGQELQSDAKNGQEQSVDANNKNKEDSEESNKEKAEKQEKQKEKEK